MMLLIVALLVCSSCITENAPDVGEVNFVNSSNTDLLVVRGAGDDLSQVLERATTHITTRTDWTRSFRFEYTVKGNEYCEPPLISYWILESKQGIVFGGDITNLNEADFWIRDRLGPNLCWSSKRGDTYDIGS